MVHLIDRTWTGLREFRLLQFRFSLCRFKEMGKKLKKNLKINFMFSRFSRINEGLSSPELEKNASRRSSTYEGVEEPVALLFLNLPRNVSDSSSPELEKNANWRSSTCEGVTRSREKKDC